jgi:hypothetical protein
MGLSSLPEYAEFVRASGLDRGPSQRQRRQTVRMITELTHADGNGHVAWMDASRRTSPDRGSGDDGQLRPAWPTDARNALPLVMRRYFAEGLRKRRKEMLDLAKKADRK